MWIATKYFLTAAVVVLVSEVAKRSDKLGGLVAALPHVPEFERLRIWPWWPWNPWFPR